MRRSITGPLIVIAIGAIFLVRNFRPDLISFRAVADYWPFLLIGAGIIGLLEVLVHARIGKVPHTHLVVEAEVPEGTAVERAAAPSLPADWDAPDSISARTYGDAWLAERRTAILLVPSVVAREEWNVLVNPAHPLAASIVVGVPRPAVWDERLFSRR